MKRKLEVDKSASGILVRLNYGISARFMELTLEEARELLEQLERTLETDQ